MTSILEQEVTNKLTLALGRAPTSAEIANGVLAPYPLSQVYRTLNAPQSIFSISASDDIQDAIDALSSNGGGVLNLLPGNYVLTSDIEIPTGIVLNGSGPTNTAIIGSGGFIVKAHGTAMVGLTDIGFMNLGIFSCSAGSALDLQYITRLILSNVVLSGNNNGLLIDNCSQINASTLNAVSSTGYGITVSNSSLMDWRSVNAISNGGAGMVFNTVSTALISPSSCSLNTGNGVSLTSCSDMDFLISASGNGAKGVELVSGNSRVTVFNAGVAGNTSDGIKLTATSDNTKIYSNDITGNGGYGVNIAASSCDNTIILGNDFSTNSSGSVNDSGTTTLIRSNLGVADN